MILLHPIKVRSINSESSRQICVPAIGLQERAYRHQLQNRRQFGNKGSSPGKRGYRRSEIDPLLESILQDA